MFTIFSQPMVHPLSPVIRKITNEAMVVSTPKLTFIIHPEIEVEEAPQFDRAQLGIALGNIDFAIAELKHAILFLGKPRKEWDEVHFAMGDSLEDIWQNIDCMATSKQKGWGLGFGYYHQISTHWPQWLQGEDPMLQFCKSILWIHEAKSNITYHTIHADIKEQHTNRGIECLQCAIANLEGAQKTLEAQWDNLGLERPTMWAKEYKWATKNFPHLVGEGK